MIKAATLQMLVILIVAPALTLLGCQSGNSPDQSAGAESPAGTGEAGGQALKLGGRVLDENGRPIAGAEVLAVSLGDGADYLMATTTSTADGTFQATLRGRARTPRAGFSAMRAVVARKDGRAIGVGALDPWDSRSWIVRLGPAGQVSGTVVDEAGRPVAGAAVHLSFTFIPSGGDVITWTWPDLPPDMPWLTARTDAAGRFTFHQVPRDAGVALSATASGYAQTATDWNLGSKNYRQIHAGDSEVRLVLSPESRLEGVCLDEATGRPGAGVPVNAYGPQSAQMFTDSQGRFSASGLSAGKYSLAYGEIGASPLQPGADPWLTRSTEAILDKGEVKTGLRLMLTKGGLAEVHFTDSVTGRPVEGAIVIVTAATGWDQWGQNLDSQGFSDSCGVAELRLLPRPYWLDHVVTVGYCTVSAFDSSHPEKPPHPSKPDFTVTTEGVARFEVRLQPAPRLRGRVVDDRGRPLAGVEVVPEPGNIYSISFLGIPIRTDADGKFEIALTDGPLVAEYLVARLPAQHLAGLAVIGNPRFEGGGGHVFSEGPEPTPPNPEEVLRHQTEQPVELRLAAASLAGEVVDAEGQPAVNVPVTLRLNPGQGTEQEDPSMLYDECCTDAKGRFEFQGVAPGATYGFWANYDVAPHRVNRTMGIAWLGISVPPEQRGRLDAGRIVLPAPRSVSGLVVDSTGKPVAGADVIVANRRFRARTFTDSEGRFSFDSLCPGRNYITASDYQRKLSSASDRFLADFPGQTRDFRIVVMTPEEWDNLIFPAKSKEGKK